MFPTSTVSLSLIDYFTDFPFNDRDRYDLT